jgi:hypothetical protein
MADPINSDSTRAARPVMRRWGGQQRLPDYATTIGVVLSFLGLYDSFNIPLIVSGIVLVVVSFFLRDRTQFGQPGRPLFQEEYARQPDGSFTNYKLRLMLTKPEIFLYAVGSLLVFFGVKKSPYDWFLIVAGLVVFCLVQLYGNSIWFGRNDLGFSDSLSLAYEKLPSIGSEVRGEGYVVRRIDIGLRYIEGHRSLTLRSGWAFAEKARVQRPDGSSFTGDKLHVIIRKPPFSEKRWDAPHDKEKIPNAALIQISAKVSAALNSHTVFHVHT